jgi:hypothetical protein
MHGKMNVKMLMLCVLLNLWFKNKIISNFLSPKILKVVETGIIKIIVLLTQVVFPVTITKSSFTINPAYLRYADYYKYNDIHNS